ncbi:MAG: hypothetical protein HUJ25_16870 [Crocinitomicaceae bacterium]|nr:hypothetical protein [Crocinitomicaceae bacterium]
MKRYLLYFFLPLVLLACNKEPGEGGTSKIVGKLYRINIDVFGNVLSEYYEPDRDVYIIYGNEDKTYDNDFSTSYDGSFEFKNLLKGDYTIFAYTRCDTCASGDSISSKTITIEENKTTYDIGDLIIYK